MPDCKPFSLLCTKNFLALAGAFLVTIAQGGAAYPGDCAECSVRRMSVVPGGEGYPPARTRRALFPAALAIPAPGERTISNAEVPLPRSPLSLAAGTVHRKPPPVVFASNREFPSPPLFTRLAGSVSAARAQSRGCKGRSPLHKKTNNLPLPRRGRGLGG